MYFDGAFAHQGAGAGAVLISPTQDKLYYIVQLCFQRGEKVKQHKGCGGATPPCCYNVYSTSVEGTASTCCARYHSRGECRLIGQQEFNPELLGHKIYSKILDKNNKFYYR